MIASTTIRVGNFSREVEIKFRLGHRDTKWDVYPNTPEEVIYVQVFSGGDIYRYDAKTNVWFKSPVAPIGGAEIVPGEYGIDVESAREQIEKLVNTRGNC